MSEIKVGDRVRINGYAISIDEDGCQEACDTFWDGDIAIVVGVYDRKQCHFKFEEQGRIRIAHIKQCRKLVKKQKYIDCDQCRGLGDDDKTIQADCMCDCGNVHLAFLPYDRIKFTHLRLRRIIRTCSKCNGSGEG